VNVVGALEDFGRGRAEGGFEKPAVGHTLLQRVRYCAWLLMNFLQHEVPVQALLRRIRAECTFANRALDAIAFPIDDADRRAANLRDVAFLEEHKAARDRKERRDVRRDEVLIDTETDNDRAALAREDDAIRIVLADDRERIGALELGYRGAYGFE
jgi:hypothetical protein